MSKYELGVLNMLTRPSDGVMQELRGGMREAGMAEDAPIDDYIFRKTESIERLPDRIERREKAGDRFPDYYRMTLMNFEYAYSKLTVRPGDRVLEVGANFEMPFLRPFADAGAECYATNIFFFVAEDDLIPDISRVAGDMAALPYRDDFFDFIVFSATLHHAPDLPTTVREVARVLKPSGTLVVLSEPVQGWFKNLWSSVDHTYHGHGRDDEIHEGEYSLSQYVQNFNKVGLTVQESFFSPFYARKLEGGQVSGVRFAPIARVASWLWRSRLIRKAMTTVGLRFGQLVLGMQMNLIVRKRA